MFTEQGGATRVHAAALASAIVSLSEFRWRNQFHDVRSSTEVLANRRRPIAQERVVEKAVEGLLAQGLHSPNSMLRRQASSRGCTGTAGGYLSGKHTMAQIQRTGQEVIPPDTVDLVLPVSLEVLPSSHAKLELLLLLLARAIRFLTTRPTPRTAAR
eukprot:scaffold1136_cov399-Prasinococcus_capsulatus_cf.AAC.13